MASSKRSFDGRELDDDERDSADEESGVDSETSLQSQSYAVRDDEKNAFYMKQDKL